MPSVPPLPRHEQGVSREEILADYPYLEDEDITAALFYAVQRRKET
ncbi:MAG: DUF433 domain-containing protein [Gammaproteobacteria bacterium]|nr:MAG: DUF433 domain-containing protein [Gammaproteobacteria bacterium]